MNIGIIGAGAIARAHCRALSTIKNCNLAGVYDISLEYAKQVIKNTEGDVFDSVEDLIEEVDAVIVATPNFCHKEHSLKAILKNKHVLCEKPMAISTEEAEIMRNLAKKTDKVMAIGFNYRYLSYVLALKKLIQTKEIGEIISVKLHFKKNSALRRKAFTWRDDLKSNKTSGALGDLGIHLIDLLWFLFESEFIEDTVRSKINTNVAEKEGQKVLVDDYSEVYGLLKNKVFVNIITSKSSLAEDCGFSIEVIGTKKTYKYHSRKPNIYTVSEGLTTEDIPLPLPLIVDPENEIFGWADSFRNQMLNWASVVSGKANKSIATFEDGFRSQLTLDLFFNKSNIR